MRGHPKDCTTCGRRHWSIDSEECPRCRKVAPSRSPASRFRVLDHDLPASPSIIKSPTAGRCIGDTPAHERRCHIHWRRLSHRHCPTVGCGRPMSPRAKQCGACTALEIFEPQARQLREIMHPEPKVDPFASIHPYSELAADEYLADMLGLPVTVAL